MKITFKDYYEATKPNMGMDLPKVPKPVGGEPKGGHPVPKGYKRVKDGSFYKLVKVDEAASHYSTDMLMGFERGLYSKHDVIKIILTSLKRYGGADLFNSLSNLIKVFRDAGHDWPEFKAIEKSLKEDLNEISLKHAAAAGILGATLLSPKHTSATQTPTRPQQTTQTVSHEKEAPAKPTKIQLAPKEEKAVATIVKRYGVDEDLATKVVKLAQKYEDPQFPKAEDILAIVGIESSFNPAARSGLKKDPAVGLMQFRPAAWKIEPAAMTDVETQIKKGAEILHTYYRHLFSHKDRAIQAYNIGLEKFKQARDNPEDNQDTLDAQKRYLAKYQKEVDHYDL